MRVDITFIDVQVRLQLIDSVLCSDNSMTLSCSSTDFEKRQRLRPSRAVCCLRFRCYAAQFAAYNASAFSITCSFPSGGIHAAASHPSSISPRQRVTAGLAATPQRRHSAFTEYVRNNRLPEPVIRVRPALGAI